MGFVSVAMAEVIPPLGRRVVVKLVEEVGRACVNGFDGPYNASWKRQGQNNPLWKPSFAFVFSPTSIQWVS